MIESSASSELPLIESSIKTLVLTDLVDSTKLVERLGDERSAHVFARQDRLARDLLVAHGGREIDKTDGFLLLFDRLSEAIAYALDYHDALIELSKQEDLDLAARVGIHVGEVGLRHTSPEDVARGAKPIEVEGLAKPVAARIMSLALGKQTLLSRAAFELARKAALAKDNEKRQVRWLAHGSYLLKGVDDPVEVYEVGFSDVGILNPPPDSEKAKRIVGDDTITGWRPVPGLEIPLRPNWILAQKLGEGGFGEAWLGEHKKTHDRRVFKFCHRKDRIRALRREVTVFRVLKEALGDRDDIARLLDWNFDEAPFFIETEYTAGGDLTEWIINKGGLDEIPMETRISIVIEIAQALAAAHSVGVLHKDIKPSNVLIHTDRNGFPHARLTDFGIGMITDHEVLENIDITAVGFTELTEDISFSSTTGTRLYMPPELLEGKEATLRADVYALGIVLFQLAVSDLTRAIAPGWERDIEDPLLREDIANMVEGNPERRVGDALRVAESLRALDERRATREREEKERLARERSRKRRKMTFTALAVISVLAVLLVLHSVQLSKEADRANQAADRANNEAQRANREAERATVAKRQAEEEADRANQEAEASREVSDFLASLFKFSNPFYRPYFADGEKTISAEHILEVGTRGIANFTSRPLLRATLSLAMGEAYRSLGNYEKAEPLLSDVVATRREHGQSDPLSLSAGVYALGWLHWKNGKPELAAPLLLESIELLGDNKDDPKHLEKFATLAYVYEDQGRYDDSEQLLTHVLSVCESVPPHFIEPTIEMIHDLGSFYLVRGNFEKARPLLERTFALLERAPDVHLPGLAPTLSNLGVVYIEAGLVDEAEPHLQKAIELYEETLGETHPEVAVALCNLAGLYNATEDWETGLPLLERALSIQEEAFPDGHLAIAQTLTHLGRYHLMLGDEDEAESYYRRSVETAERVAGRDHPELAYCLTQQGALLREVGALQEAEQTYRRAIRIQDAALGPLDRDRVETLWGLARVLRDLDRVDDAKPLYARALDIAQKVQGYSDELREELREEVEENDDELSGG